MPLWHHSAFWNIEDGFEDDRRLGSLDLYDQQTQSKAFRFWLFYGWFRGFMLQPIKWNIILVQKIEILKMASKMAVS